MAEPDLSDLGLFFDRKGRPIDTLTWGRLFGNMAYQSLANDYIRGVRVSTIWTGTNTEVCGPPMIFETMVFVDPYSERWFTSGVLQVQYPTEEAAFTGHAEAVALVRRHVPPYAITAPPVQKALMMGGNHG